MKFLAFFLIFQKNFRQLFIFTTLLFGSQIQDVKNLDPGSATLNKLYFCLGVISVLSVSVCFCFISGSRLGVSKKPGSGNFKITFPSAFFIFFSCSFLFC
jgi:hypothetical protein